DHCASELLCIVAVDYAHFSPARPLGLHTHGREPILLWQYSMRNCEAGCEGAWLLEIDGEAEHHATAHIDNDGQRRALDRPPMLLIDHNYVHGRMGRSGRQLAENPRRQSDLWSAHISQLRPSCLRAYAI